MPAHPLVGDGEAMGHQAERQSYEFRVRGHMGEALLAAFPDLRSQVAGRRDRARRELPDQAALYGVLAQLEALGLELLEVRRPPTR